MSSSSTTATISATNYLGIDQRVAGRRYRCKRGRGIAETGLSASLAMLEFADGANTLDDGKSSTVTITVGDVDDPSVPGSLQGDAMRPATARDDLSEMVCMIACSETSENSESRTEDVKEGKHPKRSTSPTPTKAPVHRP